MAIRIEYQPSTLTAKEVCAIDAECFPDEPQDAEAFADTMQQDFFAAWDDGGFAGYAQVRRRPDVSWLARIGTAAAHRRRGVATALMTAALEHCARIGLPETVLYVRAENPTALRLYQRFGFRIVEPTSQFVFRNPQDRLDNKDAAGVAAVSIPEVPESSLPRFPREWANIAEMHLPPETHVLVLRDILHGGAETIGYCRLTPGFPGCFPFVLDRPSETLMPALCSMKRYLQPDKPLLKLTVWDPAMAEACRHAGMELNYEPLKMHRNGV